ncbi:hypothetical protein ACLB1R_28615 [Escherichia coli]
MSAPSIPAAKAPMAQSHSLSARQSTRQWPAVLRWKCRWLAQFRMTQQDATADHRRVHHAKATGAARRSAQRHDR